MMEPERRVGVGVRRNRCSREGRGARGGTCVILADPQSAVARGRGQRGGNPGFVILDWNPTFYRLSYCFRFPKPSALDLSPRN